ncbi:hypothetical protein [Rhizobium leguminosarum]|uniref:hypothetical protein n=1 Tax=Rhizobium leguminosarum TaxID=384 RepID=UPI003D7C3456
MIRAEQIFEPTPQLTGLVTDLVGCEFGSVSLIDDARYEEIESTEEFGRGVLDSLARCRRRDLSPLVGKHFLWSQLRLAQALPNG